MIVKSPPVRKRMARRLKQNVQRVLKGVDPSLKVIQDWEKIEVIVEGEDNDVRDELIQRLSRTPGIVKFHEVVAAEFIDVDQAARFAYSHIGDKLEGKTFCVRVKRHGNHDFGSTDAERLIGSYLMLNANPLGVKLKQPDVQVSLEILSLIHI